MQTLFYIYCLLNACGLVFCVVTLTDKKYPFEADWFFNPFDIYENNNVNWFGAFVLWCIVLICMTPEALIYYLYKLCTIGRKDE